MSLGNWRRLAAINGFTNIGLKFKFQSCFYTPESCNEQKIYMQDNCTKMNQIDAKH